MSVSDTRRMEMYETLIDRLGGEPAATLMEFLPPGGWENVATKDDLRLLKEDSRLVDERLTSKIDGLDSKIDTGLTAVHSKIDTGLTAVHNKIDGLDNKIDTGLTAVHSKIDTGLTAVHSRIDGLDSKIDTGLTGLQDKIDGLDTKIDNSLTGLRGEFALAMARQTRTIVVTMVGIAITIWLALLLPIGAGG